MRLRLWFDLDYDASRYFRLGQTECRQPVQIDPGGRRHKAVQDSIMDVFDLTEIFTGLETFSSPRPPRRLSGLWRRRDRLGHPSSVQPMRVILIGVARCGTMRVVRPQRWWAARCPVRDARSPSLPVSTRLNNAGGVLSLVRSGMRASLRARAVGMGARHRIGRLPPRPLSDLD
jgi:hypothetical protein